MHKNCLYKIIKFNKSCQKVYRLWLHTLFQLEVILMSPSLLLRKSPIDFKSWQRTEWMHQHRISTAVSERGCSRCESSTQVVHISFIVMKCLYLKKSTEFYCCISCVLSICLYLFLLHKVSKIHGRYMCWFQNHTAPTDSDSWRVFGVHYHWIFRVLLTFMVENLHYYYWVLGIKICLNVSTCTWCESKLNWGIAHMHTASSKLPIKCIISPSDSAKKKNTLYFFAFSRKKKSDGNTCSFQSRRKKRHAWRIIICLYSTLRWAVGICDGQKSRMAQMASLRLLLWSKHILALKNRPTVRQCGSSAFI